MTELTHAVNNADPKLFNSIRAKVAVDNRLDRKKGEVPEPVVHHAILEALTEWVYSKKSC